MADLSNWTDNPYKGGGTPADFARYEQNHGIKYKDHTRIYEHDDSAYDMPMPHETAKRVLDKLEASVREEIIYFWQTLHGKWFVGKDEYVADLELKLTESSNKATKQREAYQRLYQEFEARVEAGRLYRIEHQAEWAERLREWTKENSNINKEE